MNYQTCLKLCISNTRKAGAEDDIAIYEGYPKPSDAEWAECLQEVVDCGDDLQNPCHCMGKYELRLSQLGIKTVLDSFIDKLKAIAIKVGVPSEHVADVITLWLSTKGNKRQRRR